MVNSQVSLYMWDGGGESIEGISIKQVRKINILNFID